MPYDAPVTTDTDEQLDDASPDTGETEIEGPQPMSAEDIQSAMHRMVSDAVTYADNERSEERKKAAEYYLGEPLGNEESGRSTFVMTIVRDTVKSITPSLMRMFFGGEQYVEFTPRRADAIEGAEQATDYISDIVIGEDNPGFLIFHSWFTDALVKREGITKWWHEDNTQRRNYVATNLAPEQVVLLSQDPEVEITELGPSLLAVPGSNSFDVEFTQTKRGGKSRFDCLPPEEFLRTKGARSLEAALFIGHRTEKTKSELLEMGVAQEDIDAYGYKDASLDQSVEEQVRQRSAVTPNAQEAGPEATERVLYIEGYPYLDVDGDGIAELVKVNMLGPGYQVIGEPEPWPERPFAWLCPHPEPHTMSGQSVADLTMDLQKTMSMIVRSMLDSLALALHNRLAFVETEVNVEDVLNTEIGAPIRMRSPNAIQEIGHTFVGKEALPVLEFVRSVLEERTGVTRASAGLNAEALQSSTQIAVAATVSKAQEHIELIGRIFAETGVKQLMRGLLRLENTYQHSERIVRVRGKYVPMDPRAWDATMDVRVNVALGSGLHTERIATLAGVAQEQWKVIETFGPANPLVTLGRYRETLVKMLRLAGRKDADTFFNALDVNWMPPPAQPQPDPNMVIAQAELQKAQAEVAKKQADVAADAQRIQLDDLRRSADLELKREEMMLVDARERQRIEVELALKIAEMRLKAQTQLTEAGIKAEVDKAMEQVRAETKLATAEATKASANKILHIRKFDDKGNMREVQVEQSTED